MEYVDFEDAIKIYTDKLKKDGKDHCRKCMDNRNLNPIYDKDTKETYLYCIDCIYIDNLLSQIKKI
jgi:hypothetical protein